VSDNVLSVENLVKFYGKKIAVDHVTLSVDQQQIFALLGDNGSGKTTCIRLMLGLQKPSQGSVHVFGQAMSTQRINILRRVGALVEYPSYYGHLSGHENLDIVRRLRGLAEKEIDEVLEIVRLTDAAKQKVHTYSQGMKQRLAVAMALLGQPELIILDEPTNGLDPVGIREMRELILGLPQHRQTTVFIASHLLSEVEQIATHVGILSQGRLLFNGTLAELRMKVGVQVVADVPDAAQVLPMLREAGFCVALGRDQDLVITGLERMEVLSEFLQGKNIAPTQLYLKVPSLEEMYFILKQ
jgi:ABC-2 type transport system ATP-binding protein